MFQLGIGAQIPLCSDWEASCQEHLSQHLNQNREFGLHCGCRQQSDREARQGFRLDAQMALHPA